ncbi:hypothetical protein CSUI_009563, partial [Cystoisospora suis]
RGSDVGGGRRRTRFLVGDSVGRVGLALSRGKSSSCESISSADAPHALAADLLEQNGDEDSESLQDRRASGPLLRSGAGSGRAKPSRKVSRNRAVSASISKMALQKADVRYENDIFRELQEKVKVLKERQAPPEVFEHRAVLGGDALEHFASQALSSRLRTFDLGAEPMNVEIRFRKVDPEWAFQQFSGKKIDSEARFDDSLDRLYEREYSSHLGLLELIHKEEEQLPEESGAGYVLRLNGVLEEQRQALDRSVKNYVATDVPLQNVLFGRTQFTPEGDPVDVDLFDVYCPEECLAVDDLVNDVKLVAPTYLQRTCASGTALRRPCARLENAPIQIETGFLFQDGLKNERIAAANVHRRAEAITRRLDQVFEEVYSKGQEVAGHVPVEAWKNFSGDTRDLASQLTALDFLVSSGFSEEVLDQLAARLQVVQRQLDEQEEFLERRRQQRAREKQRQLGGCAAAAAELEDLPDEWKPEKMIEKLHEFLSPFAESSGRVELVASQLEKAFAAQESLVALLKRVQQQEKQHAIVKTTLGSALGVLKTLDTSKHDPSVDKFPVLTESTDSAVRTRPAPKKREFA